MWIGYQEYGFDFVIQLLIYCNYLEFIFKIGNCLQVMDDGLGVYLFGKMYQ